MVVLGRSLDVTGCVDVGRVACACVLGYGEEGAHSREAVDKEKERIGKGLMREKYQKQNGEGA